MEKSNYSVYILYSVSADRYYIGQTEDLEKRLIEHNQHVFKDSFTLIVKDMEIIHEYPCVYREQALKIEYHIKKAKKRLYLENLRKYPEISLRLLEKDQK